MTDDVELYYNAWKNIFAESAQKLLCIWHVDRAWRGALKSKITDNDLQCKIYHALWTIMEQPDITAFNEMLSNLEQLLQEQKETQLLAAEYFHNHYATRAMQWALRYCKNLALLLICT